MSIVRTLIQLVDIIQHREEVAKHKRWMQQFATPDPDDRDPLPSLEVKEPSQRYRCKFCSREETNARFCPDCLADTMRPIPQRS